MTGRLALSGGGLGPQADFVGAKLALICGSQLLTYLRDDRPDLRWAGRWDLPGGGREGAEGPQTCVLRELHEEFGLDFGPERLEHGYEVASISTPDRLGWFFLGHITEAEVQAIRFGDEGQYWRLMGIADFLVHPQGIPPLQDRCRMALARAGWWGRPASRG